MSAIFCMHVLLKQKLFNAECHLVKGGSSTKVLSPDLLYIHVFLLNSCSLSEMLCFTAYTWIYSKNTDESLDECRRMYTSVDESPDECR